MEHTITLPMETGESFTVTSLTEGEILTREEEEEDNRVSPQWSTNPSSHSVHLQGFHKQLRLRTTLWTTLSCIRMVDLSDSQFSRPDIRIQIRLRTGTTNHSLSPTGIRIHTQTHQPHRPWTTHTVGQIRIMHCLKMEDNITHNSVGYFPICLYLHLTALDSPLPCSTDRWWQIRGTSRIQLSNRIREHHLTPMFHHPIIMWDKNVEYELYIKMVVMVLDMGFIVYIHIFMYFM